MTFPASKKQLLINHNQKHYRAYTLNDDEHMILQKISIFPWIAGTRQLEHYSKKIIKPKTGSDHLGPHIKFILKNESPHTVIWQTRPKTLKKAVRWGIVKAHSITAKVIAALGQYHVIAHERIAKGMVSNAQAMKINLLDLYQDRFEALQALESMVNKTNDATDYQASFASYIQQLTTISNQFDTKFSNRTEAGFNADTKEKILNDIRADIDRAEAYLAEIKPATNLHLHNSARGTASIMTFVQQQMIHGLYELQSINQDMTYSNQRYFALTRGELNDYIENARKEIDNHEPDPCNTVTDAHHGFYSTTNDALISYDFSDDELTPTHERLTLLAISFIEEWDKVVYSETELPVVYNASNEKETLDIISSTRWKQHRTLRVRLISLALYLSNMFKSMLFPTIPWEEEAWSNPDFHLFATKLREHAKPNEPLWKKPARLFMTVFYSIKDLFYGIHDAGSKLSVMMPSNILNDWESSKTTPSLEETLKEAMLAFENIESIEKERLKELMPSILKSSTDEVIQGLPNLARVEYMLTAGEQNDILTALARGMSGFTDFMSHHLYAKDPLGGLLFTSAYATGVAAMFYPTFTSSILGDTYVTHFSDFAHWFASSQHAATMSASLAQGNASAIVWDSLMHGPSGVGMKTLHEIGENPLTAAVFLSALYGLGYFVVNGVDGKGIPWLSNHCQAQLGTKPYLAYPGISLKLGVGLHEAFKTQKNMAINAISESNSLTGPFNKRIALTHFLSTNMHRLPQLSHALLFKISRHIQSTYEEEDSASLKTLLYPVQHPSIAFQFISIPLSYVPAVLRLGASLLLSLAAFSKGHAHPEEPIKRASSTLFSMIKKDLSRLIVLTYQLLHLPYQIASTLLKTIAMLTSMLIGRVAGLVNVQPAHSIYKSFTVTHTFFKSVTEFFYPGHALKQVTVAHPNHTFLKLNESYRRMIEKMPTDSLYPIHKKTNSTQVIGEPAEDNQQDAQSSRSASSFAYAINKV